MAKVMTVLVVVRKDTILPSIRELTVPWLCLTCRGPRGEPFGHNFMEDGESYYCHRWDNPCGHTDSYVDVIKEYEHAEDAKSRLYDLQERIKDWGPTTAVRRNDGTTQTC